jgi:7-cyano-7-deazaguanine synthase
MANLATRAGVTGQAPLTIHTPLMKLSKGEIIRKGVSLEVDYAITHSCYDPDPAGRACGACDSCLLRHQGFVAAGVPDPTPYQAGVSFD